MKNTFRGHTIFRLIPYGDKLNIIREGNKVIGVTKEEEKRAILSLPVKVFSVEAIRTRTGRIYFTHIKEIGNDDSYIGNEDNISLGKIKPKIQMRVYNRYFNTGAQKLVNTVKYWSVSPQYKEYFLSLISVDNNVKSVELFDYSEDRIYKVDYVGESVIGGRERMMLEWLDEPPAGEMILRYIYQIFKYCDVNNPKRSMKGHSEMVDMTLYNYLDYLYLVDNKDINRERCYGSDVNEGLLKKDEKTGKWLIYMKGKFVETDL